MQPAGPSMLEGLMPLLLMIPIFYFLMIRPQQKKAKDHEAYLKDLKRGDSVVTAAGILGTIDGLTDLVVTLEIANGVKIKILRRQIAGSAAVLANSNLDNKNK